jgi:hypothetical protein
MSPLAPQVIPSATSPLDAPVAPITYAEINGVAPQAVPVIVSSIEVVTVCDPFDKWISDNQMLVAAALVLGYLSAWGRGK